MLAVLDQPRRRAVYLMLENLRGFTKGRNANERDKTSASFGRLRNASDDRPQCLRTTDAYFPTKQRLRAVYDQPIPS